MFTFKKPLKKTQKQVASSIYQAGEKVDDEVMKISELIEIPENRARKTSSFWETYKTDLPKLFSLFLILENIPSTSSSVERFFSITGLISDKRRLAMKDELIEYRSMLKANASILKTV